MIVICIEIFTMIILFLVLCAIWKKFLLKIAKNDADKAFECFTKDLNDYYAKLGEILNSCKPFINCEQYNVELIKANIEKALQFSILKDGNGKIIGYANAISFAVQDIISSLEKLENKDQQLDTAIQNYSDLKKQYDLQKEHYNKIAARLRHYVDVFPTSLMARLKKITAMDYAC